MGFKKSSTQFKITYADGPYQGFEFTAESVPLEYLANLAALDGKIGSDSDLPADEQVRLYGQLFDGLAENLVSWNMEEDDDTPIPCTPEEFGKLDYNMKLAMFDQWFGSIKGGVPAPLPEGSSSGLNSVEGTMPMEALSASQAS